MDLRSECARDEKYHKYSCQIHLTTVGALGFPLKPLTCFSLAVGLLFCYHYRNIHEYI